MSEPKPSSETREGAPSATDTRALIKAIEAVAPSDHPTSGPLLRACASALRRELDKSQRFLDTVETMIVGLDPKGRITLINRRGCELLGYSEDQLLGRSWFSNCLPAGSENVERVFQRIMSGELEELNYFENEVLTRSGERRMVAWHNNYMRDNEGAIVGTLSAGDDITARKLAEQRNEQLLNENRRLMQRLFTVQERERRRLARELHDELGQWLSAVQVHAQLISDMAGKRVPRIQKTAEEIRDSVDRVFLNLRRMIRDLRPVMLDALGLPESLAELVASFEGHHPDISCRLEVIEPLGELDEALSITVFRIVQEALTNVANHAEANQVQIQVHRETPAAPTDSAVLVTVSDNGKGMKPDLRSQGTGLLGMRERALGAGGSFELETNPSRGVRIRVRLPPSPPKPSPEASGGTE